MCGIDFMGLFVSLFSINDIFVVVDYVCKSVEAVPIPDEGKRIVQFLKHNIFERFGTPRSIINDGGLHFCNQLFAFSLNNKE